MSERNQRKEAAFACSSTLCGTISVICICATIAFVAYRFFGSDQAPRRLWSPVVIEANGNENVLGDTRQMEFWTPSVRTKDYLTKPGEKVADSDKWQVIPNDDMVVDFGTALHTNKSVLGYRRVEVWGHGSTSYKPGWWWTLTVLTNYSAVDLGRAYQDYWKPHHPVFIEVIDNRGRVD